MRTAHSGGPDGLLGLEPPAEERGDEGARRHEDPVHLGEGQVREDDLGLVLEQVGQRPVGREAPGGLDHPGDQHVLEVVGLPHDHGQGGEEPGHLGLDDRVEHGVLAPGKGPVEGGPGDPRLAGDVVDGGLGRALAGQAAQGGVDHPDPLRGAVVGAQVGDHGGPRTPGRGAGRSAGGPRASRRSARRGAFDQLETDLGHP